MLSHKHFKPLYVRYVYQYADTSVDHTNQYADTSAPQHLYLCNQSTN